MKWSQLLEGMHGGRARRSLFCCCECGRVTDASGSLEFLPGRPVEGRDCSRALHSWVHVASFLRRPDGDRLEFLEYGATGSAAARLAAAVGVLRASWEEFVGANS